MFLDFLGIFLLLLLLVVVLLSIMASNSSSISIISIINRVVFEFGDCSDETPSIVPRKSDEAKVVEG